MRLKIGCDLMEKDYQRLIIQAECDKTFHQSSKPCKLYILNREVGSEIICDGVKLSDGCKNVEGDVVQTYMKFAFRFRLLENDVDLVENILKYADVEIDGRNYYIGEYKWNNEVFDVMFISYNLFAEEEVNV